MLFYISSFLARICIIYFEDIILKTFIKIWEKVKYGLGKASILFQINFYGALCLFSIKFDGRYDDLCETYYNYYTKEGRQKLANIMVQPIRRALDYQAIGRNLLMVEPLPEGAYARYTSSVVSAANEMIPRFEVALNPTMSFATGRDSVKSSNGNIYDNIRVPDSMLNTPVSFMHFSSQVDWSLPIDKEERSLYNYLFRQKEIKLERLIQDSKQQVNNSIQQLQLGE